MNTKMTKKMRGVLFVLLIESFFVIFLVNGCNTNSYYTRFDVREGNTHFSFEYPSRYEKPFLDTSAGNNYSSVSIQLKNPVEKNLNVLITISTSQVGETFPDSKYLLDYKLKLYESGVLLDYEPIERYPIIIMGIEGEAIFYSSSAPQIFVPYPNRENVIYLTRKVLFSDNNIIWEISVDYDKDYPDTAESDFQHLLQTLKVLD
jgi:hypothetical protein